MESNQETNDQNQKDKNLSEQEPAKEESSKQSASSDDTDQSRSKQWLEDNLRIIVSVVIVILIAGGIYSYSKRGENPDLNGSMGTTEQSQNVAQTDNNTAKTSDQGKNQADTQQQPQTQAQPQGQAQAQPQGQAQPQNQNTAPNQNAPKATSSVSTSQETSTAFVETAVRGDSETKLARRALADYLEKNSDSTLTAEHKIYIEDYLRKNVPQRKISVGTSVEFSKGMIAQAIAASKNLNSRQLQNLHHYAVSVPSLS
ncbi:MAG: hypothetical protein P4L62_03775 [Candidatus Pacebacteria bacterium]|nr:hypothetical protein [Candidatus Paceibacterota bacterium]MDR3583451.1 hypothetical protein [Candidatus Paceibacterota bacterium]